MVKAKRTTPSVRLSRVVRCDPMMWFAILLISIPVLAAAQSDLDFGDAPDAGVDPRWSYPTLLADDGARHLVPANPTHFLDGAPTPFTERVGVDRSGKQGNDESGFPSISGDGRFVAFTSDATNLVSGDTNGYRDVFVHDRDTGATTRVSVDSSGVEGNFYSGGASISADGRYVAFCSSAWNLAPGGSYGDTDIFVHDRDSGATTRVSVDSSGVQGSNDSFSPSISADGRYVAFESFASNLAPGCGNGDRNVFVHDRDTGATTCVSVSTAGVQGDDASYDSSISADARYVAFGSDATNLAPCDTNEETDVFVHDRDTGVTARVSVGTSGTQGNKGSSYPSISADGRYVAFQSGAATLVPVDTNGVGDVFVQGQSDPLDAELDGGAAPQAIGDDGDGNDDEDGVRFLCCMEPGGTAGMEIDASAAGFVNAWIDFDGDGVWGYGNEQILTDHAVAAGWNEIVYDIPTGAEIPRTYARVRFTSYDTVGSLGVTGQADDGEVEDYWVEGTPLFADGFETGDTVGWTATSR